MNWHWHGLPRELILFVSQSLCRLLQEGADHGQVGDGQVDLDGVQDSHPVVGGLASGRLLAVHVEEDGQEVLSEAAHLGLVFFYRQRRGNKRKHMRKNRAAEQLQCP